MDNQTKINYLKQYTSLAREYEDIRDYNVSKTYNVQAKVLSHTPTAKSFEGDSIGAKLEKLENVNEWVDGQLLKLECKRMEIIKTVHAVEDLQLRRLLWLRYIDGMKWDDLADKMNFTSTHIHRLHRSALDKITLNI